MIGRQIARIGAPARLDGRPACQALPAVAMVGAPARIGILVQVVRHAHVPHLGVHQAVNQLAVDHAAAADPRTYRQVDKRVEPLGGAPAMLAQGRAVYVRVEADRDAQRRLERADKIRMSPVGFWRGGDIAVGGRPQVRVDRPKARDADRRQGPVRLLAAEERHCLRNCLGRLAGGKAHFRADIVGTAADGAHELGASGLNSSPKLHIRSSLFWLVGLNLLP